MGIVCISLVGVRNLALMMLLPGGRSLPSTKREYLYIPTFVILPSMEVRNREQCKQSSGYALHSDRGFYLQAVGA